MFIGHGDGIHQVHSFSVDLEEGHDVASPHRLVQDTQVHMPLVCKALLRVLGCDVILPSLPEGENTTKKNIQDWFRCDATC